MQRLWKEHPSFCRMHLFLLAGALGFPIYRWMTAQIELPMFGCLVHNVLHLYCPLCGGTRALDALLHGRWETAWNCNPMVVLLLFAALIVDAIAWVRFFQRKKTLSILPQRSWLLLLFLLLGYGVFRNLAMILFRIDPLGDLGWFWNR